ncbi:MAG TPA: aspartate-semialdehyde dehydrogenase [Bryobacteraceae bacterium]|jgi:aspartate-semialdehyde dehydrogenase|nr:aspartate-semialdehyde dehydrogenase [Bryobacteraceae bacterium]
MERKIEVGILGATGMVGQHFVKFLQGHSWFDLKWLGASDRSAGKKYRDAMHWHLGGVTPETVADIVVEECKPGNAPRLLFSAMDASVATEIEQAFAQAGHIVVSNSKNHRMDADVPLLVPEINPDHLKLIPGQQRLRNWKGQIVTNPNCSTVVLTMGLAPLKQFGITKIIATTLQAISGAGYPGVPSMDIMANVIPFIGGEEEKMQQETQKILGTFRGDHIEPLAAKVSAHCNRVPVVDGHTVTISVELSAKPTAADLRHAFDSYRSVPQEKNLPSAPPRPVIYMEEANRPQPRKDVERERGMAAFLGRLRPCPVLDWKYIALGHNTVRGAAGAAVLNAELMHSEGLLD